jgi:hypothetical protein
VVDEGSRFSFAFPLKAKSAASNSLQALILQLERKGFKPHTLRTDNGGEFTSHELNNWLAARGIEHLYSPADTPQANGLIERYHGTLMPRLRAVLHARKIPRSLWSEVLQGVVYVLNRTPHQGIDGKIPFEEFYQRQLSSLAHLRVLGSVCYYHLPGHRSKLDARKGQAILLGYSSDGRGPTAAYKIYDVSTKRVLNSTDVLFDERPAEDSGVKQALRTANVPSPPGMVIPIPTVPQPTNALTVPITPSAPSFVSAPSAIAPMTAPTAPVASVSPALPALPLPPTHNEGAVTTDPPSSCEEPRQALRRSNRSNRGVPAVTFAPGLIAECGIAMLDNSISPWLPAYAAQGERSPPVHLQEALARQDEAEQWRAACVEELESLQSKGVYSLMELPQGATSIPSMWVFAYKLRADGQIERYKSRLVAKGFAQRPGVDYNEVWAPTGCLPVLRCLFAYAAAYDYDIIQADIRTAFLNGPLEDDIYLRQPPGFSDNTNRVWKLHKALYGLKQGARAWYLQLRGLLMSLGYVPMQADPATFVNKAKKQFMYTHVDDLALFAPRGHTEDMEAILTKYEGKLFGDIHHFLGMEISRDRTERTISINQKILIQASVRRTGLDDRCGSKAPLPTGGAHLPTGTVLHPLSEYEKELYPATVGTLMYIATVSRPDIAYAASMLARFLAVPTRELLETAMKVVMYLNKTIDCKLTFGQRRNSPVDGVVNMRQQPEFNAIVYGDADFANCTVTRKSVTGILVVMQGTPVLWSSKKQPIVTKSTTAAEYVAASMAADEAILIQKTMEDMGVPQSPIPLLCDNTAAEALLKNPVEKGRTKYLEIHWHYVRGLIGAKKIEVFRVDTKSQLADVLTKSHSAPKMLEFRVQLSLQLP